MTNVGLKKIRYDNIKIIMYINFIDKSRYAIEYEYNDKNFKLIEFDSYYIALNYIKNNLLIIERLIKIKILNVTYNL